MEKFNLFSEYPSSLSSNPIFDQSNPIAIWSEKGLTNPI